MSDLVFFDEALPKFVSLVEEILKEDAKEAFKKHLFFRNADGIFTFVLRDNDLEAKVKERLQILAKERLGAYVSDNPVRNLEEMYDDELADNKNDIVEHVTYKDKYGVEQSRDVRLVERRILGADWLRDVQKAKPLAVPALVFFSLKGGVGRSTALVVAAAHLASIGKNVLIVDLDLEAPGVGSMLLDGQTLPKYGLLDYYTETKINDIDDDFLRDMISTSSITDPVGGLVDVAPAAGRLCLEYPQNMLGKLSRAYLENISDEERTDTFLDQTRNLIERLCNLKKNYDAVLVDARAGLNESTAAAVLGLGADVLLFGVDQPQTWEGYKYLFAHLARYKPVENGDTDDEWRLRLHMIHAKASPSIEKQKLFRENACDAFSDQLYDMLDEGSGTTGFNFDTNDKDAPHYASPILFDGNYQEFNPLRDKELLSNSFYQAAFIDFLTKTQDLIES